MKPNSSNKLLDVDECESQEPCKNNGTCTNSYGSYTCTCENGWLGQHCQTGKKQYNLVYIENYDRDTPLNQTVLVISSGCLSKNTNSVIFWVIP